MAARRQGTHLPGLDGLRALAVLAVMAFHFDIGGLPGGFLGVDLFFVLSGYLITSQLWARWGSGRINLKDFWVRRMRRLLPAVALLLAVLTPVMILLDRSALGSFAGDTAAAATYSSNWWYILHERPYFETTGRPPVLQHLWSLAVEEQFYLVWPIVIALVLLARTHARRRHVLIAVAGGLALWSCWRMGHGTAVANVPAQGDSSRWYYGTDTHAMGLLMGAVLAGVRDGAGFGGRAPSLQRATPATLGVGLAALAGLTWFVVAGDPWSDALYRWGFAAVALLGTLVVAAASRPGPLASALGHPLLRWIGTRSYGLYLWHWPVACFTRPGLDTPLDGIPLLLLRVLLTMLLAELSLRLVENPIRRHSFARWRRNRVRVRRTAVLFGCLTLLLTGGGAYAAHRAPAAGDPTAGIVAVDGGSAVQEGAGAASQGSGSTGSGSNDTGTSGGTGSSNGAATSGSSTDGGTTTGSAPAPLTASLIVYGDSVAVATANPLRAIDKNVHVKASVGEQAYTMFAQIRADLASGWLTAPRVVLITGNNGVVDAKDLESTLVALEAKGHVVTLVTPLVPRSWQKHNSEVIAQVRAKHPALRIADWKAMLEKHPEYLSGDGVHPNPAGQRAYAKLVADTAR